MIQHQKYGLAKRPAREDSVSVAPITKSYSRNLVRQRKLLELDYATGEQFQPLWGGHTGIGPPSGAATLGTAAYAYVPTRPTNNSKARSERFIIFLLGIARKRSKT
jgi:hypothetical protein